MIHTRNFIVFTYDYSLSQRTLDIIWNLVSSCRWFWDWLKTGQSNNAYGGFDNNQFDSIIKTVREL